MDTSVQIALIVATGPTLAVLINAYITLTADRRQAKAQASAAEAVVIAAEERRATADKIAAKVAQVEEAVANSTAAKMEKLSEIGHDVSEVKTLVNGAMSAQLKKIALALRKLANITKDPADIKEADAAELVWKDHEQKQIVVVIDEPLQVEIVNGDVHISKAPDAVKEKKDA